MDKILSDKMGHDMEAQVWDTAEELDKKLAERMRRSRRRRKVAQQKLSDMKMCIRDSSITNTGRFVVVLPDKYVQGLEVSENHLIIDTKEDLSLIHIFIV